MTANKTATEIKVDINTQAIIEGDKTVRFVDYGQFGHVGFVATVECADSWTARRLADRFAQLAAQLAEREKKRSEAAQKAAETRRLNKRARWLAGAN